METSSHYPSLGRTSSFGHRHLDELAPGEKKGRRREMRYNEKRRWREEVEEELTYGEPDDYWTGE